MQGFLLLECYFGNKLHCLGICPLKPKFIPTTIGWSEDTLMLMPTSVKPSNPGPPVVGVVQLRSRVCAAFSVTVLAPASPGDVEPGLDPGIVWPVRLLPSLSNM